MKALAHIALVCSGLCSHSTGPHSHTEKKSIKTQILKKQRRIGSTVFTPIFVQFCLLLLLLIPSFLTSRECYCYYHTPLFLHSLLCLFLTNNKKKKVEELNHFVKSIEIIVNRVKKVYGSAEVLCPEHTHDPACRSIKTGPLSCLFHRAVLIALTLAVSLSPGVCARRCKILKVRDICLENYASASLDH